MRPAGRCSSINCVLLWVGVFCGVCSLRLFEMARAVNIMAIVTVILVIIRSGGLKSLFLVWRNTIVDCIDWTMNIAMPTKDTQKIILFS